MKVVMTNSSQRFKTMNIIYVLYTNKTKTQSLSIIFDFLETFFNELGLHNKYHYVLFCFGII